MPWSLQTVGSTIFYIPGGSNLPLAGTGNIGTNSNGTIIMVGRGTKSIAVYNITGGTWSIPSTLFSTTGRSVAVGNSKYVAVGEGTNTFAITNNGTTWGTIASPPFSTAGYDIVYAGSTWVAVGTGTNSVAYFDNQTSTWVSVSNGITSGYGLFYDATVPRIWATGSGTYNIAYASAANSTWTGMAITGMTQVNAVGSVSGVGTIVAVGYGASSTSYTTNNLSFYSTDGTSFSGSATKMTTAGGQAITYGNGYFVWGGWAANTIAYSTNGSSWTYVNGSNTILSGVYRIAYGNGLFMAAGAGTPGNNIAISTTTISSWSVKPAGSTTIGNRSVGYGNYSNATGLGAGRWIIGGSNFVSMYYSDNSGNNWYQCGLNTSNLSQVLDITYGYSQTWMASIIYGAGSGSIIRSTDNGANWSYLDTVIKTGTQCNVVRYGNNQTWFAGFTATSGNILCKTTDDGNSWTGVITYNTSAFKNITGIVYANNKWYISGQGASGYQFAYSTDNGSNFNYVTNININTNAGGDIAASPASKLYVAGGIGTNNLQTSSNGTSWTSVTSPFSVAVNDVKNNGTTWVAVGEGGNTIATSSNGSSWTGQGTTTFSLRGNKVRWNSTQNKWYAVGEGGNTLVASTDGTGTSWTSINTTGYVDISGMGLAFN